MSAKFKTVQLNYKRGMWNASKVRDAVTKGWITETEYSMITGEEY